MGLDPLCFPLCFVIDAQVAPYLCLAYDQREEQVPPEIQNLLDTGKFHEAAASASLSNPFRKVLEKAQYTDIAWAYEVSEGLEVYQNLVSCDEFVGDIDYLNEDGTVARSKEIGKEPICYFAYFYGNAEMDASFICLYESAKSGSLFKPAYSSMQEFIDEVKSVFGPLNVFPDNFDWMAHIACVDGYCCS